MKVAVLDYSCGEVAVYDAPEMDDELEIQDWLENEKGHRMSDCYYMSGNLTVNIEA